MDPKEVLFKKHYEEIKQLVERRKSTWRLTTIAWEDVSATLIERIWTKFHLYDPEQPLDRWVNTVITRGIRNLLRDNLYRVAKPCNAANAYGAPCAYNLGCGRCAWTEKNGSGSGLQDSSCQFYANWEKKKQTKFAISTPLSIENHIDESHSIQSDFLDIDGAKAIIDKKIIPRLSEEEGKIYRMLFIENMDAQEVGKIMGYKKQTNSKVQGYLQIRAAVIKIKRIAKDIISEEDLI